MRTVDAIECGWTHDTGRQQRFAPLSTNVIFAGLLGMRPMTDGLKLAAGESLERISGARTGTPRELLAGGLMTAWEHLEKGARHLAMLRGAKSGAPEPE